MDQTSGQKFLKERATTTIWTTINTIIISITTYFSILKEFSVWFNDTIHLLFCAKVFEKSNNTSSQPEYYQQYFASKVIIEVTKKIRKRKAERPLKDYHQFNDLNSPLSIIIHLDTALMKNKTLCSDSVFIPHCWRSFNLIKW